MNESYKEKIKRLRPIDDKFMTILMSDKEVVQELIDVIHDTHETILHNETQKHINNLLGRSVRYDIFLQTDNCYIDIEMENSEKRATPKRVRLYSSLMDATITYPRQEFDTIDDSEIIFITENDVMGDGLQVYHVDNIIRETKKPYDDGRRITYINASADVDNAIGRYMKDIKCSHPDDIYHKVLRKKTKYYKEDEEGVNFMCAIWDEVKEEGFAEGKAEGVAEAKASSIRSLMKKMKLSILEAMEILDISIDDYDRYKELIEV